MVVWSRLDERHGESLVEEISKLREQLAYSRVVSKCHDDMVVKSREGTEGRRLFRGEWGFVGSSF